MTPWPWEAEWLAADRRLRVVFAGETVADTTRPQLLRAHGFLPVWYLPERDVRVDLLRPTAHRTRSPYRGEAEYRSVVVGDRRAESAAWTYREPLAGSPDTRGYWSFHFHAMDAWWEEDERLHVHARDPFLRVDALPSARHVRVVIGGTLVAETRRPVLLCETGLVPRWYVPRADVRQELLVASDTFTLCPYKGRARYCSFRIGERLHEDAAWYYRAPLRDVHELAGHLGFWNERDDTTIVVDGEPLPRLGDRSSGDGGERLRPSRRFFAVPPPVAMRGARAGRLQHDFAGPHGRAEGPPSEQLEMAVERAGGRPGDWWAGGPSEPPATAAIGSVRSLPRAAVFTFGPSQPANGNGGNDMTDTTLTAALASGTAVRLEESPRRVRCLLAGTVVADTRRGRLLFERGRPAVYAFPREDVDASRLEPSDARSESAAGVAERFSIRVGDRVATDAAYRYEASPAGAEGLADHLLFEWDALDAWFEEDEEVFKHARDPYHRIDVLHSSREVVVEIEGVEVARSSRPRLLFETSLPTRYYLPKLDVRLDLLKPAETHSVCPYKGIASYWDVTVHGSVHHDVVWGYPAPVPECPKIEGLLCFYNEKVDVTVDGERLERPRTPWS